MNKSPELKESQSKEPSPTIMPLKLKSNIFQNKLNKQSLNMNQSKELGKESNIFQLKPKLFTTHKEITTFHNKVKLFKVVILHHQPIKLVPLTFQLKVELELKQFIKLGMFQLQMQFMPIQDIQLVFKVDTPLKSKEDILLEFKEDILLELPLIPLDNNMLLDPLPMLLEDKLLLMLLVTVELEDKMSTKHHKLEVMLLEEVELDNIDFYIF
jgi:hypothetical protein